MPGALLTDLYQLTMLQAYHDGGMNAPASFEFFVRKLPAQRNFLVAAGLEEVLAYLHGLRFEEGELRWLATTGRFGTAFLRSLENLRFTGDVWAMPEGTVFFADEPILRVTAPMREAQLVESRIINLLHYETLVASKAARCVLAAPGKVLVDFGLRRAHAGEAGLLSARASYLAGFSGTATVQAGMEYGIPVYGTMAHSYVQAHDDEGTAFEHFARSQPGGTTLLIDTYDSEAAAGKVVALASRLAADGIRIKAVRIDSGDLGEHARRVRAILDAGGLEEIGIFASGGLDEHQVRDLLRSGAPVEGFGIGTRMNTSADAPYLDCAYKLVEYAGLPRRKRSEGKATWPGRKQVFRHFGADGAMSGDTLGLHDERGPGKPLLELVMMAGRREIASPGLEGSREHARWQLAALPARLRELDAAEPYAVDVSPALATLARQVDARTGPARGPGAPELVSIDAKVAALREPGTYPGAAQPVDVIETHMSWVFLAGQFVYKLKKPARYDGLDCSMAETRHHFCQEELRLNRRLAPAVYLDVVALRRDGQGRLHIGGAGEIVDWLVWMRRLSAHLTLERLIEAGSATPVHMRRVAEHLAAFYRGLSPAMGDHHRLMARLRREVDTLARELCEPAWGLPADEVLAVCRRLRDALGHCREVLEARVRAGRVVEGHGDLRPEHVWLGEPIAIIDCLEFSAELRTLDVADELGYLALECERLGAPQLGRALFDAFAEVTGDVPDPALVDFYQAFRACVRANIAIRHLREARYRDDPKWPRRAREYLALAAGRMARWP